MALFAGAALIITSDHGNMEQITDPLTGAAETKHNLSPVPIYIVGKEFASPKSDADITRSETEISGILTDVAPTILEIMGVPKPDEMTGESLLSALL